MSCPQQLKESNDIIESLKEQLTTFANNISLEDSTVSNIECYPMTDEQRYRYQCSAFLMTTIVCCFFIILYCFLFKFISLPLFTTLFLIFGAFIIIYGGLVHLCRKDIKENLTEKEKKYLKGLFITAASFNIFILILIFLFLIFHDTIKKYYNKHRSRSKFGGEEKTVEDILDDLSTAFSNQQKLFINQQQLLRKDYLDALEDWSKEYNRAGSFGFQLLIIAIVFSTGFCIPYLAGMGMSIHILANSKKYLDSI